MKNFFTRLFLLSLLFFHFSYLPAYGQAEVKWDATFGGSADDNLATMTPTSDGGYLLGGYSDSNASGDKTEDSRADQEMGSTKSVDYWVVKIDAFGQKEWDRTYGGFSQDYLRQVLPTEDGGYLLAGYSWSEATGDRTAAPLGREDYWVVKLDASGNKVWDKAYGGSRDDRLTTAVATADGAFLLGGFSNSNVSDTKSENPRGDRDFWVIKIDASGNRLWDKTYGGSSADELHAINLTTDGGFLLGGRSMSPVSGEKTEAARGEWFDYWVVRIDASGNKLWDSTFGGDQNDVLYAIAPAADGGFLLGGDSKSGISGDKTEPERGFGDDYWVVKINADGDKLWDKAYGGNSSDNLFSMLPVADGGFLLGGLSHSDISADRTVANKGFGDRWLVRIDATGTKLWDTAIGGNSFDNLWSMVATPDGGALLGGPSLSDASLDKTEDSRGGTDFWVVKVQTEGRIISPKPDMEKPAPEPTPGLVTGGGWFHSPLGAIKDDPFTEGRANFAITAQQKKKDKNPKGHAVFSIPQAHFRFRSHDAWEWLSVSENTAILQGTGSLNREEGYHFLLSVVDHGSGPHVTKDTYRIIIWNNQGEVVYDNQQGSEIYAQATRPIGGGNILIREEIEANQRLNAKSEMAIFPGLKVYPTRLETEELRLEIPAIEGVNNLQLSILDMKGRLMTESTIHTAGKAMSHSWKLNSQPWPSGIYLLIIRTEGQQYQQKLLK